MDIEHITVYSAEYLENGDIKLVLHDPQADQPSETSTFIASPDDVVETGRELYQRAVFGEFGPVATALPLPEIPLDNYQSRQTELINEACHAEIVAGFESSALGAPHQYPFKEEDQSNLLATFMLAKELGVSKPFKCWDSAGVADYRMHTVAELTQVGQDADAHKMAALLKANTKKIEIAAATTAAEVESITW